MRQYYIKPQIFHTTMDTAPFMKWNLPNSNPDLSKKRNDDRFTDEDEELEFILAEMELQKLW